MKSGTKKLAMTRKNNPPITKIASSSAAIEMKRDIGCSRKSVPDDLASDCGAWSAASATGRATNVGSVRRGADSSPFALSGPVWLANSPLTSQGKGISGCSI